LSTCLSVCLTDRQTDRHSSLLGYDEVLLGKSVQFLLTPLKAPPPPFMLCPPLGPSTCSSLHMHSIPQQSSSHSTQPHFTPQYKQLYTHLLHLHHIPVPAQHQAPSQVISLPPLLTHHPPCLFATLTTYSHITYAVFPCGYSIGAA
jgi:hypothetical protein